MRARLLLLTILATGSASRAIGQMTFPNCYIQNANWTNGVHHYTVPQPLYSPGGIGAPLSTTGSANTEFTSATQVRLTDGFHAGNLTGEGRFRAHIDDGVGNPDDLVVITPAADHITEGVLHVEKWEKLELGYKLPQEYRDAIGRFFDNYYHDVFPPPPGIPNPLAQPRPDLVDAWHDLNPYADDSLQLVMTLISPSGEQRMKWGFYMKEAAWDNASNPDLARLTEDLNNPFHVRFRFAPDEEGVWQFNLSIKAPHTSTLADEDLPVLAYAGYGFVCVPPMPDNKGYLKVHPVNRRILQFEDGTPFFGLGTNMSDLRHGKNEDPLSPYYQLPGHFYYKRDHEVMKQTMEELHAVGGNFLRMLLMPNIFAPEWVNLGVYDRFAIPPVCSLSESVDNPQCHTGWTTGAIGNCQYQCWALDQMIDHARDNGIYIQMCVDPYPPIVAYEKYLWGDHPYVINYLDRLRQAPPLNPYDMKEFFFQDGDLFNQNDGVFYYWKRKYKYIMSRWGYSVNLAAIEPFNEIDQMLSYNTTPMSDNGPVASCNNDFHDIPNGDICRENRVLWQQDPQLPGTISEWLSAITEYVRGDVVPTNPAISPLGEKNKLFLMSYAGGSATDSDPSYFLPFFNPDVDLIDQHKAHEWEHDIKASFDDAQVFHSEYGNKPFHQGEYTTYGDLPFNGADYGTYQVFDNYDVSFHNELWASTFFGNFSTGAGWSWERVFWWPDGLPSAPDDADNWFQQTDFSAELNVDNHLDVGTSANGVMVPVKNRKLHHHFRALSALLNDPNWLALDFFNGDFTAHKFYPDPNEQRIECYYLLNAEQNTAIGWVHNLNAYYQNNYYITKSANHFLNCVTPNAQSVALPGFEAGHDYFISYFPTRLNTTDCPTDDIDDHGDGVVRLNLSSAALNGIFPTTGAFTNHLDTLHSDYAFIITPSHFKSLHPAPVIDTVAVSASWDFALYPNPAHNEIYLRLQDDAEKEIVLLDLAGRRIEVWTNVTGKLQQLSVDKLAMGTYYLRVSNASGSKTKKLIVQ